MKRYSSFSDVEIRVVDYGEGISDVEFVIPSSRRDPALLELLMLLWGESESWTVGGRQRLVMKCSDKERRFIEESSGTRVIVNVTATELERMIANLLRWYRDGTTPVDHIDIEFGPKSRMTVLFK